MAIINGTNGNDTLAGLATGDEYRPLLGHDTVDGGAGTDLLTINYAATARNITLSWSTYSDGIANWVTYSNIEQFNITTGSGSDYLQGAALVDTLMGGGGNDRLKGGGGLDSINGGLGNDTWVEDYATLAPSSLVVVTLSNVADLAGNTIATVTLAGVAGPTVRNIEALALTSGSQNDSISSGPFALNDDIHTNAGNDTINVGTGGRDYVDGGAGTDLGIFNWSASTTDITVNGWDDYDDGQGRFVNFDNVERFNLTGGSGNDSLMGDVYVDTLLGGAGNDTLNSARGADILDGGIGVDIWQADYSTATGAINVQLSATLNANAILGGIAGGSAKNLERLYFTSGGGNDLISSAPFAYTDDIRTGAGTDTINVGLGGRDYVDGGDGTDLGIFNWSASTTDITVNGWDDYDDGQGRFVNFDNVERFNLTGGSGNDSLMGDVYVDTLLGGAGNDTLNSARGADILDGGTGVDIWQADYSTATGAINVQLSATVDVNAIRGGIPGGSARNLERLYFTSGAGNDLISTAPFAYTDDIRTGAGDDTINVGLGGRDYVLGGLGTDLGIFDWSASITNITVNGWDDYDDGQGRFVNFDEVERFNLTGGSGNDSLMGDIYADILVGGAGNDTLNSARGADTLDGGTGVDIWQADYSSATGAINLQLSATLNANAILGGIAGGSAKNFERLYFTSGGGNDLISTAPFAYTDDIRTGAGDDTINVGLGGRDYVLGGLGTDLGIFNWSASTTNITVNGWDDYDDGQGRFANFDEVERFNLTGGSGNDTLYGKAWNDVLIGNNGNDTLTGGTYDDTASGLPHNVDLINGGAGIDLWAANYAAQETAIVVALNNTGVNEVTSGISDLTTTASVTNIERLALITGAGNDSISTGLFAYSDDIRTGAGTDTINVGTGGRDYVDGGDDIDLGVFNWSASTTDITVNGWDDYADGEGRSVNFDNVERFNLTGGSGNDYLGGDAYADTLVGGAGNDTLDGFAGNDTLAGGAGGDIFYVRSGGGNDVISGFAPGAGVNDVLYFVSFNPFAPTAINFTTVMQHMADVGGNVVLTLSATDHITLLGVTKASFVADDFYFS